MPTPTTPPTPLSPIPQPLAAGHRHSLSIRPDGSLWAWGDNDYGQLGTGDTAPRSVPTRIGPDSNWLSVSTIMQHSLAIRQDGTLWGWGDNTYSQLGDGTMTSHPVPVQIGTFCDWHSVSTGNTHTLALRADGSLWAWGENEYEQLGAALGARSMVPVQIFAETQWRSVSTGPAHTVAVTADHCLWSWGDSHLLPLLHDDDVPSYAPVCLGQGHEWARVYNGGDHHLALTIQGTLWAWGDNTCGQLGLDLQKWRHYVPTRLDGAADWVSLSVGDGHSLGVRADGTLWGWGDNQLNVLGLPDEYNQCRAPVQIGTATDWAWVSTGDYHTLAQRRDGSLWAWGNNEHGEVGHPDLGTQVVPRPCQVGHATDWRSVSAGVTHSLGIRLDGSLWAWGQNFYGQRGGGTDAAQVEPLPIAPGTTWQQVSAGTAHSLGIQHDGSLWAWGCNEDGQLAAPKNAFHLVPTRLGTDTDWRSVHACAMHSLALRHDGTLWAWGHNLFGQLGIDAPTGPGPKRRHRQPVPVMPGSTWQAVSSSDNHVLALHTDGSLWAWGSNTYGQLGDGSLIDRAAPVPIGPDKDWLSVHTSYAGSLARRRDGSLWAWGWDPAKWTWLPLANRPVALWAAEVFPHWQQLSVGHNHVLALSEANQLYVWGHNDKGQLGDGDMYPRDTPTLLAGRHRWLAVSAGGTHSLAIRADGTLWNWGSNREDQLAQLSSTAEPLLIIAG
ncbi:hypothetical protein Q5H93_23905 [Hymenobacter sp. ASUV-10]|uniref:RCC1-like domain-containing protein n=1 Tax=Hymenobacter aranciens TaxID=3063996 RepID=A0ABT9BHQ4_9BACT|nr:hypothetical protein [Hymenobacter sp. ASUV-10]MDO7877802.1 hypothetical protein [Hymenobacter sp. ASUV-10]